jgi:hypothetical protein
MSYATETEVNVSVSLLFNTRRSLQTTASLTPHDVSATLQTAITTILWSGLNALGITSILLANIGVGEALASITFNVQVQVETLCHFSDTCRDQTSSNIGSQVKDGIEKVMKASVGTVLDTSLGGILITGSTVSETFKASSTTCVITSVSLLCKYIMIQQEAVLTFSIYHLATYTQTFITFYIKPNTRYYSCSYMFYKSESTSYIIQIVLFKDTCPNCAICLFQSTSRNPTKNPTKVSQSRHKTS